MYQNRYILNDNLIFVVSLKCFFSIINSCQSVLFLVIILQILFFEPADYLFPLKV